MINKTQHLSKKRSNQHQSTPFDIYQQYSAKKAELKRPSGWRFHFTQMVCAFLIVSFLSMSTPAATQTISAGASEMHRSIRFYLLTGNFGAAISSFTTPMLLFFNTGKQSKQIDQVKIFPESVTVSQGEKVDFSAIAYDSEGDPVNGVGFEWKLEDIGRQLSGRKIQNGSFYRLVVFRRI